MSDSKELTTQTKQPEDAPLMAFSGERSFALAQRMAKALSSSSLVPSEYRGENGLANCMIAMEIAARTGSSVMAVMQNLHVIQGRPSWSSSYIIAALNSCGRFSPLRFKMDGEGDTRSCHVETLDRETGETLEGPKVDIAMAKAEGWYNKNGSKWKTMPDVMLRYRAASFFGRLYAPDILMGMHAAEEVEDYAPPKVVNPEPVQVQQPAAPEVKPPEPEPPKRSRSRKSADEEQPPAVTPPDEEPAQEQPEAEELF